MVCFMCLIVDIRKFPVKNNHYNPGRSQSSFKLFIHFSCGYKQTLTQFLCGDKAHTILESCEIFQLNINWRETFLEAQFPLLYGKIWRLSGDEKVEKMRGIITGMMIHDCEKMTLTHHFHVTMNLVGAECTVLLAYLQALEHRNV